MRGHFYGGETLCPVAGGVDGVASGIVANYAGNGVCGNRL